MALCFDAFALIFVPSRATRPTRGAPSSLRQPQHLFEEALQRRQVPLPKITDRAVVRHIAGGQHPERHVLDQPSVHLAGREHADAVRVASSPSFRATVSDARRCPSRSWVTGRRRLEN